MGHAETLVRDRDRGELVAHQRHQLPAEQPAQVTRLPQRRQVDEDSPARAFSQAELPGDGGQVSLAILTNESGRLDPGRAVRDQGRGNCISTVVPSRRVSTCTTSAIWRATPTPPPPPAPPARGAKPG